MSYKTKALRVLEKYETSDPKKKERINKAKGDFWFFCKTYLPHKFSDQPAPFHKVLIDIYNTRKLTPKHIKELEPLLPEDSKKYLKPSQKIEGIVNCWPREHGKTTVAEAYILWNALFAKEKFILIIAASKEMAVSILENIKDELEENILILEDFGEQEGRVWKQDLMYLKNGVTIMGKGMDTKMRGLRRKEHRPSLILLDDVMDDISANSPALRDKLYRKFKRAVLPLSRDAFVIITNTILHGDDLPSRLLKEIQEGSLKDWVGIRFEAITPSGEPLWESRWPLKNLLKKKEQIGSIAFAQEYLNRPMSDEDRLFKEEWLQFYTDSQLPPLKDLRISVGVDPATGKSHGDYSAIVVVGKDPRGVIYTLYTYVKKVSPQRFMEEIIEINNIYRPRVIVFEEVAFQEVYKKLIMEEASKRGVHLPIKGIKPKGSKELRASRLSPLIENGLIKLRENQKELIEQLLSFPKGAHDDAVDALMYAVSGLELGGMLRGVPIKTGMRNNLVRATLGWLKGI